jgi:nucleoside-diphosphate-sugar epimerase
VDRLVINVGSGQEVSVRELVDGIREATGRPVDVIYSKSDGAGVSRMRADITRAGQKLGFHPRVGLAQGLRLTIDRDPRFAAILMGTA